MESYTPLIQYTAHISSKNTYLNKKLNSGESKIIYLFCITMLPHKLSLLHR